MPIDPSQFELHNVADTCAVWNILGATTLARSAEGAGVRLCLTRFVEYECIHKPRTSPTLVDAELQQQLRQLLESGRIPVYPLNVSDLQDVGILERRKRLGKGELASIAFANKTRQAFLTDDQKARELAREVMESGKVQTTPHLFGWLVFEGRLTAGDQADVLAEHARAGGPLAPHLRTAGELAEQFRRTAERVGPS